MDSEFVIKVLNGELSNVLVKADFYSENERSEIDEELFFEEEFNSQ